MNLTHENKLITLPSIDKARESCLWLAHEYYQDDQTVLNAAYTYSPYQFLRLFITAQGMKQTGNWQTHTYARFTDHMTNKDHFFLIPTQRNTVKKSPCIRFENNQLCIDDIETNIVPQSIPHTTPFWYFHYDPNKEDQPFYSMTLNFSPACIEKCVLCAGAKTGRVNNGMNNTLNAMSMMESIFKKHPEAIEQLDSVAVVTGCFNHFDELKTHLTDIKSAVNQFCKPTQFRVLEHNIETPAQLDLIVNELGYDIFITLECFDQHIRNIALNGKVGRKGRNKNEFIDMIKTYAHYMESAHLNRDLIRVTYLVGLDSFEVMEECFKLLSDINNDYKNVKIIPWLSIFTSYNKAMNTIKNHEFDLPFLFNAISLSKQYFDPPLLLTESGGTAEGYARGLY